MSTSKPPSVRFAGDSTRVSIGRPYAARPRNSIVMFSIVVREAVNHFAVAGSRRTPSGVDSRGIWRNPNSPSIVFRLVARPLPV